MEGNGTPAGDTATIPAPTALSDEERMMGRELVRLLNQVQSIAQNIARSTGHPLTSDVPETDLAESLGETAGRVRREFLGEAE